MPAVTPGAARTAGEQAAIWLGIGLTLVASLLFAVHDAVIKWLVIDFSVPQILAMRSLVTVPVCVLLILRNDRVTVLPRATWVHLVLRGVLVLIAWLCFYSAARRLQLAELTAIYYLAPLLMTLAAATWLGEQVSFWRWAGVITGFLGVVLACQPGRSDELGAVLLVLLAATLWAYSMLVVRRFGLAVPTLVHVLVTNLVFLAGCLVVLPWLWQPMAPAQLLLMLVVGVLGGLAQFMAFDAVRRAPASIVAPFEYSGLVWAFALGFLVWGDLPASLVVAGAVLIILGGLLVMLGEWRGRPGPGNVPV